MKSVRMFGLLALMTVTSCVTGVMQLETVIAASEETVREPLGATTTVSAECRQANLHLHTRRAERVRLTTYEVETVPRDAGRFERGVWVWDVPAMRRVTHNRRVMASREVIEPATGVATAFRIVTDGEVLDVETDVRGEASLPLDRLFGPTRTPGRITLAHGEDITVVQFDGTAVTCTAVPREHTR